jgi:hypothetical protein
LFLEQTSLVILEHIEELFEGESGGCGLLTFFKVGHRFGLSWIPEHTSPAFSIFQSTQAPNKWAPAHHSGFILTDSAASRSRTVPLG